MQNESRQGTHRGSDSDGGNASGSRAQGADTLNVEVHGNDVDVDAGCERQVIADEEVNEIGSLGNEDDDPEGWMSERVDYWESLPPAVPPTREAWLRSVIANSTQQLAALTTKKAASWPAREPDLSWTNLANDALGLPRMPTGQTTNPIQVKQEPDDGEEPECEMALA